MHLHLVILNSDVMLYTAYNDTVSIPQPLLRSVNSYIDTGFLPQVNHNNESTVSI